MAGTGEWRRFARHVEIPTSGTRVCVQTQSGEIPRGAGVEIITRCSSEMQWSQSISLLIDGLHEYENVARDFHASGSWIAHRGYIAFHDYATQCPGVIAFVNELLCTDTYKRVHIQR